MQPPVQPPVVQPPVVQPPVIPPQPPQPPVQPPQPGVNQNPALTVLRSGIAVSSVTINEGESLALTLTAADPDGDNVVFEVQNNPSSSSLAGNLFSWTPNNVQDGVYVLTFRALDVDANGMQKGGSDSKQVAITVNDVLSPLGKPAKRVIHSLDVGSIIVNGWDDAKAGDLIDIDVVAKNRGNEKAKDVRVTLEIPQLNYYSRSDEFSIKKRHEEIRSFSVEVPRDAESGMVFAIVTISNDKDEEREVMGFLVE